MDKFSNLRGGKKLKEDYESAREAFQALEEKTDQLAAISSLEAQLWKAQHVVIRLEAQLRDLYIDANVDPAVDKTPLEEDAFDDENTDT